MSIRGSHKLPPAMARPWPPPTWALKKMSMGASWPPRRIENGGQLGRLLAAKTPSKMKANLDSQKSIFEAQVGLHFGGVLAALGAHRAFFWRPKLGSLWGGPSWPTIHFSIDFNTKWSFKRIVGQFGPPQQGAQLGPPKKCYVAPHGRQDPPKMEANLGLKK